MYDVAYDLSKGLKLDYNATAQSRVDEMPGDPKTQANRDTIIAGLSSLGRPTQFHQTLNVNWQIPVSKLPFMDWTSASVRYSGNYDWQTNSTAALNPKAKPELYFGNRAQNSNNIQFSANANFINFYNQVPFLRKANQRWKTAACGRRGAPQRRGAPKKEGKEEEKREGEERQQDSSRRSAAISYDGPLSLADLTDKRYIIARPHYQSYVLRYGSKCIDVSRFRFCIRPSSDIKALAAANGWLTENTKQPNQFQKTFTENLNFRATVEPWQDFRIQITASKVAGLNSSSIFRYHDPN